MTTWGAGAATLNVSGGQLIGASGVDVGGNLFNVAFVEGRCDVLFGGCNDASDFTFDNQADATLASQALLDQVFIDGPDGAFDSTPFLTFGCESPSLCRTLTPFAPAGGNVLGSFASNTNGAPADSVGNTFFPANSDTANSISWVYADWSVVPEPGTALLLGLGLAGISATRRR